MLSEARHVLCENCTWRTQGKAELLLEEKEGKGLLEAEDWKDRGARWLSSKGNIEAQAPYSFLLQLCCYLLLARCFCLIKLFCFILGIWFSRALLKRLDTVSATEVARSKYLRTRRDSVVHCHLDISVLGAFPIKHGISARIMDL